MALESLKENDWSCFCYSQQAIITFC
jgi:hypothetical protein